MRISRKLVALIVTLLVGVGMIYGAFRVGVFIGAQWYSDHANDPWHMNNYYVVRAEQAYTWYGLVTLLLGGLFAGLTVPVFFLRRHYRKILMAALVTFFVSIALTGLGFNTLDWMLGCWYMVPQSQTVTLLPFNFLQLDRYTTVEFEPWNYYFFLLVLPMWIGGFLVGLSSSVITLVSSFIKRRN